MLKVTILVGWMVRMRVKWWGKRKAWKMAAPSVDLLVNEKGSTRAGWLECQ